MNTQRKPARRLLAASVALLLALSALGAVAQPVSADVSSQSGFAQEFAGAQSAKPQIRWWWPDGLVDDGEIRNQIRSIADAGFGGAEVICKGSSFDGEDGTSWGSDAWLHCMEVALEEAKSTGIHLTFTISSGWPAVTPAIQSCDDPLSIKQIGYGSTEVIEAGSSYTGAIPKPETETGSDTLLAVVAAQLDERGPAEGKTRYLKEDSLTVLTGEDGQDGGISWTAPDEGSWVLLAFYMQAGSDEEYPAIDHFSKAATDALTGYWNERMITWGDELNQVVDGIFEDSLELDPDALWTPGFLQEFQQRRGYDLTPYLPLIFVDGLKFSTTSRPSTSDPADFDTLSKAGERVRMDYYQTLTDLYAENHIQALQNWCEGHGWNYRGQVAYGAPMEMTQAAAEAGVAETESLYFAKLPGNGSPKLMDAGTRDGYRLQGGVVNLTGKEVYSSELSPIRSGAYEQSAADLLNMINSNLAGGVNLSVVHGYSNSGVYQGACQGTWGGYDGMSGFFSNSWDRTPDFTQFSDSMGYVARNQYVLRQGNQNVDLAYYRMEYFEVQVIADLVTPDLEDNGYTYDFVSPYLLGLDQAEVKDGVLAPNGPSYRALVVDNEQYMPLETAQRILSYLDGGLKVFFIGELPSMTTGYADAEQQDSALCSVMQQIKAHSNAVLLASSDELAAALRANDIEPDADFSEPCDLVSLHRTDGEEEYYYLYNPSSEPVTTSVEFSADGTPYQLNAWDGRIDPVACYREEGGNVTIEVTIPAYGTALYAFSQQNLSGGKTAGVHAVQSDCPVAYDADGNLVALVADGDSHTVVLSDGTVKTVQAEQMPASERIDSWTLTVESWHPGDNPSNNAVIAKTNLAPVQLDTLVPWNSLEGMENVSGIGTYEAAFVLDSLPDALLLDLGTISNCSYRVAINGTQLPPQDQFDPCIDIAPYLQTGENTVTVTAASTLINAALVNGMISPIWQFTGDLEPVAQAYGMLGKGGSVTLQQVQIVPLVKRQEDPPTQSDSSSDSSVPTEQDPSSDDGSSSQASGSDLPVTGEQTPLLVLCAAGFVSAAYLVWKPRVFRK